MKKTVMVLALASTLVLGACAKTVTRDEWVNKIKECEKADISSAKSIDVKGYAFERGKKKAYELTWTNGSDSLENLKNLAVITTLVATFNTSFGLAAADAAEAIKPGVVKYSIGSGDSFLILNFDVSETKDGTTTKSKGEFKYSNKAALPTYIYLDTNTGSSESSGESKLTFTYKW